MRIQKSEQGKEEEKNTLVRQADKITRWKLVKTQDNCTMLKTILLPKKLPRIGEANVTRNMPLNHQEMDDNLIGLYYCSNID